MWSSIDGSHEVICCMLNKTVGYIYSGENVLKRKKTHIPWTKNTGISFLFKTEKMYKRSHRGQD